MTYSKKFPLTPVRYRSLKTQRHKEIQKQKKWLSGFHLSLCLRGFVRDKVFGCDFLCCTTALREVTLLSTGR